MTDPYDDVEEIIYTEVGSDQEVDSEWRWTLDTPTEPGPYGLYEPDRPGEVQSVLLKDGGLLGDGRTPSEIRGVWFVGIPEGQFLHLAMFAGPPEDLKLVVNTKAEA